MSRRRARPALRKPYDQRATSACNIRGRCGEDGRGRTRALTGRLLRPLAACPPVSRVAAMSGVLWPRAPPSDGSGLGPPSLSYVLKIDGAGFRSTSNSPGARRPWSLCPQEAAGRVGRSYAWLPVISDRAPPARILQPSRADDRQLIQPRCVPRAAHLELGRPLPAVRHACRAMDDGASAEASVAGI